MNFWIIGSAASALDIVATDIAPQARISFKVLRI
jgi:hypothetical protein